MATTQVLIIGAGPTGLSLACQLIHYGIDFIVIDKKEGVTPFSKALGVHARTLEIYEQLDLAKPAVEHGQIAGKVRMLEGGQVRGEVDLSNIGQGMSPYPYMLVLEQSRNEQMLYDYLRSHGREVWWQTEFESFSQHGAGVTAQVNSARDGAQTIEAAYLAGCDGPKSPVRHGLGLLFEGSTFERLFYVADVQIDWEFPHDALHVCLAKNSVVAFFPMRGDRRWRIVGAFPERHNKDEGEVLYEEIEQRIRAEADLTLEISHVNWFSTYKVHARHVERFSSGRCFLAGDAAHIHTPAGGQGMNTGIQDAYNLAWKLALVLKGAAGERLLETYNEERLPNAERLLRTTDTMFNLAAGDSWWFRPLRTTVFPATLKYVLSINAVKKLFFPMISQIGINYRRSSLSDHDGDRELRVKAGDRMPYFLIDGQSIYDRLHAPKFHLLTFDDGQGGDPSERGELDGKYALLVDQFVIPLYPHVAKIFGTNKSFSVLLRPDNHIALISPELSLSRFNHYMNMLNTWN
jgi:2-polyprenyl-6-methoxyphenol hydroxylase-like FAD-dependent oxidoreductase